jgi:hypothetical protein
MSSIAGELVTGRLEYDGGRQVTAYVPPALAEAVVFAGDGQLISQWSESLEAADVPSTMIVGVHRLSDEMLQLHEYSPVPSSAGGSGPWPVIMSSGSGGRIPDQAASSRAIRWPRASSLAMRRRVSRSGPGGW